MSKKRKFSFETKMGVVQRYLAGESTANHEATLLGINPGRVFEWISIYQSLGEEGLRPSTKRNVYSTELKESAVLDYLSGEGSQYAICRKYGLRSSSQLRSWILKYNSREKVKTSGTGGCPIMTKGRKTTFEERIEIVHYCISHKHNYSETAKKYQVSYEQARNYTIKYKAGGIDALKDKRGKRKQPDDMNEIELLRAEIRILKAEKEQAEMEASFLKKLEEIERGWD